MLKKYFRKPKRIVVVKSSTKYATEAVTEKCFKKVLFERSLSAAIVKNLKNGQIIHGQILNTLFLKHSLFSLLLAPLLL